MMVQRQTSDLATPAAYTPRAPCRCHFETRVSFDHKTAPADCVACETGSDCARRDPSRPSCNFHFCEPRPAL
jgi:hypothetical protein